MYKEKKFETVRDATAGGLGLKEIESFKEVEIEGHLIATLRHNDGTVEVRDLGKNIITTAASVLLARLIKDNTQPAHGAFGLAVGTGNISWNPLAPPSATAAQTQLESELFRKIFQSVNFINGNVISGTPTNVLDLTTFFTESEAVGALDEMGLVGGDSTLTANTGTLINYRTFAVISKPNTATLTITWRLTF